MVEVFLPYITPVAKVNHYFGIGNIPLGGLRVACLFCLTKVNISRWNSNFTLVPDSIDLRLKH
jgi:hypothetical protein